MAASAQLCGVSDVKQYLGITHDNWDELFSSLIGAASEAIENFCRRRFGLIEYTEYHDGSGSSVLLLDHCPIESVEEIRDDPSRRFESCPPIDEDDYVVYDAEGLVLLLAGTFHRSLRNVRVIYTAGYAAVPDAVKQACVALVAAWFNRGHQGGDGLASESLGDYSVAYRGQSMLPEVTELLIPYLELYA